MILRRTAILAAAMLLIGSSLAAGAKADRKKARKAAAAEVGATATATASAPEVVVRKLTMRGVVFEDINGDGRRDADELGLPDFTVSNGFAWTRTTVEGAYELVIDESITGTAFVYTPPGWKASHQFYVTADFDEYADKVQQGDIGLQRDDSRKGDSFSFVQLTDTHVIEVEDVVATMIDDLGVVNRITDKPAFVAVTGDLVNRGERVPELKGYARAIRKCKHALYSVIGNHDYGGEKRKTENYERYIGPRYFSFGVGNYHFIAKDIISTLWDQKALERQDKWIEEDIRLNAGDRRIIVLQHFIPTNQEMDWWSRFKTAAIFSGHWHGRRERLYKGILDVNSAPLRFGGIDRSPRGFRIIHINGDKITCEWRVAQQDKRVEIIHPTNDATVGGESVHLQVLAYDTVVRVDKVRYRIEFAGRPSGEPRKILEGDMSASGRWMWTADCRLPVSKLGTGDARVVAEASAADGSVWRAESSFQLAKTAAALPKMGEPWRFFHGDAGHRGYLSSGPRPPLTMAWATNVGGTVLLASPVIENSRVYAGTGFGESLDDCAVYALDLQTGKKLWRAPVDSSIQHSLAAWNDNILAVSQAGRLYCFDALGKTRWKSALDGKADLRDEPNLPANVKSTLYEDIRWELSFPVTDGRTVYAGCGVGFGAYSLEMGKPIWFPGRSLEGGKPLTDWWPSIYSGPSIGTGLIYQGGKFMRALDAATGKVAWTRADTAVSTVAVVPAVVERDEKGDRLYVFQNDKTLLCLDGKDGQVIWQASRTGEGVATSRPAQTVPMGQETGTPAVGEKVICLGSGEVVFPGDAKPTAAMHGFDKMTGQLLWRYPVGMGVVSSIPYKRNEATITSSPVIVGDVVYFGANDGYLYALNVQDGTLIWRYRLGVPIASTVAVTGNTVVVSAWDGTVYAFTSDVMNAR